MAPNESTAKHPLCREIIASDMVTIKIGADATSYRVHEALLTHYSEYFRGALRSGLEESRTRTFTLKDVRPYTFEAFVNWLYTQTVTKRSEWNDRC